MAAFRRVKCRHTRIHRVAEAPCTVIPVSLQILRNFTMGYSKHRLWYLPIRHHREIGHRLESPYTVA